jgi:hypothetical protein
MHRLRQNYARQFNFGEFLRLEID